MTIFRVTFRCLQAGTLYRWAETEALAKGIIAAAKEDGCFYDDVDPERPPEIEAIEMPATKVGMLNWLNINFTTDNG